MPIQTNNLPIAQPVPVQEIGKPIQQNFDHQDQIQRANQPWTLRIYQNVPQTIPYNTNTQIGFDTVQYNTYKALNRTYNLRFISATLGGNVYPNAIVVLPQYGYYQFSGQVQLNTGASGGDEFLGVFIENPTQGLVMTNAWVQSIGSSPINAVANNITDIWPGNPGDHIQMNIDQLNSNGVALPCYSGSNNTWLTIRYLGLT